MINSIIYHIDEDIWLLTNIPILCRGTKTIVLRDDTTSRDLRFEVDECNQFIATKNIVGLPGYLE